MALRGRAIPNRPVIGRAQSAPVALAAVSRFAYARGPVNTGRPQSRCFIGRAIILPVQSRIVIGKPVAIPRPRAKATYGRVYLPVVALPAIPTTVYIHKPVAIPRPQAKATFGRVYLPLPAAPAIIATAFIGKPARIPRPQARSTYGRVYLPLPTVQPAIPTTQYIHRPVDTGRRVNARATYGRIRLVSAPLAAIVRAAYIVKPVFTGRNWVKAKGTYGILALPIIAPRPPPDVPSPPLDAGTTPKFIASFAGVPFNLPTPAICQAFERDHVLESMDALRVGWPSSGLACESFGAQPRHRGRRLGSLFDPAGAGRHALGVFVATSTQVAAIRAAGGNTGMHELKLQTAQGTITRQMRMLPPKPLGGNNVANVFVVPLVDWRYDALADDVPQDGPYSEWGRFFDDLDNGHLFNASDSTTKTRIKAAALLAPSRRIWNQADRWPAVCEATCATLGIRHTGDYLVDPVAARVLVNANLATYNRMSGGLYPWAVVGSQPTELTDELKDALPSIIKVLFRVGENGLPVEEWDEFHATVGGNAPAVLFKSTGFSCDDYGSGSGSYYENTRLQLYVNALATSIVEWGKLAFLDLCMPGIVDFKRDGVHDLEWVYNSEECWTRAVRAPWYDGVELVHATECDVNCACGGEPGTEIVRILDCVSQLDMGA